MATRAKDTTRLSGEQGCEAWRSLCGGTENSGKEGGKVLWAANCLVTTEGVTDPQDRWSLPWNCKSPYLKGPGHCVHEGELC